MKNSFTDRDHQYILSFGGNGTLVGEDSCLKVKSTWPSLFSLKLKVYPLILKVPTLGYGQQKHRVSSLLEVLTLRFGRR